MTTLTDELRALARRVEANLPRHTDPQAFHAEKSEIIERLREMAKEARS